MTYVLKLRKNGKYVARWGAPSSYTPRLEDAQRFTTKEAAETNRCPESEDVVALDEVLR